MSSSKQEKVWLYSGQDSTVRLAWNEHVPADQRLEPVGGVRPMQPPRSRSLALVPGLNLADRAELSKAAPRGADDLPAYVSEVEPTKTPQGPVLNDMIERSAIPALEAWRRAESRQGVVTMISARIAKIKANRKARAEAA